MDFSSELFNETKQKDKSISFHKSDIPLTYIWLQDFLTVSSIFENGKMVIKGKEKELT